MSNDKDLSHVGRHQTWWHILLAYAFFIGLAAWTWR